MVEPITPFLKWAGGKRWFVRAHLDLFPSDFNSYIEPFLGGGSVFLHLRPSKGLLSDINPDLIHVYETIRDNWRGVERRLKHYQQRHSREFYYEVRASTGGGPLERAVRFIYLNRTCWNGLYRVNKNGKFNVPIGTKSAVTLDSDCFEIISEALQGFLLQAKPFAETLGSASENDFVFIDPPYTVRHNYNGFIKYNDKLFSWDDQVALRDEVQRLQQLGAKVLLTNANHPSIRRLYSGVGTRTVVHRASVLAASADKRGAIEELAIKVNY